MDEEYRKTLIEDELLEEHTLLTNYCKEIIDKPVTSLPLSTILELKQIGEHFRLKLTQHKKNLTKIRDQVNSHICYMMGGAQSFSNTTIYFGSASIKIESLGELPTEKNFPDKNKNFEFIGKDFIYPIGFKFKRKYFTHKESHLKAPRAHYICGISEEGFYIKNAQETKEWKGENILEDFNNDMKEEDHKIISIREFFYLDTPSIQRIIESIGDVDDIKGYIPVRERLLN